MSNVESVNVEAAADLAVVQPIFGPIATAALILPHASSVPNQAAATAGIRLVRVSDLAIHPAAKKMPRTEAGYQAVLDSIAREGQLHPLSESPEGILDGVHRLRALKHLKKEFAQVITVNKTGSAAVTWAYESKAGREHKSDEERALLAVAYKQQLSEAYCKERAQKGGRGRGRPKKADAALPASVKPPAGKKDSRKETCEMFNISTRQFGKAAKLFELRPELFKQAAKGEVSAAQALKQVGRNAEAARIEKAKVLCAAVAKDDPVEGIENNIHVGDALMVMKTIASGCASLVMYSPPYIGVPVEYDPPLPPQTYQQYLSYHAKLLKEAVRVSKRGGRLAIVLDTVRCNDLDGNAMYPIVAHMTRLALKAGWRFKNDLAWCKGEISGSKTAWGSFGRCSAPMNQRNHETILLFFKETHLLEGDPALCDFSSAEHGEWGTSTWHVQPETNKNIKAVHPAPFPVEIAKRLIKMFTYGNDLVIDPFNGSGTTTTTAKSLSRRFIGIDQSDLYCRYARYRTVEL